MNIDEAKRFLEMLSQKTQSGGFTPAQFNLAAQRAQIQLFERDFKIWQATETTTESLSYFVEDNSPFAVPSTGQLTYPANYYHTIEIRKYYVRPSQQSIPIPVETIEASEVGSLLVSQLTPPTQRFPKVVEYDAHWQFYPKDVGNVMIDYFRQPVAPVWAFILTNNVPVYNALLSVDFEFPDFAHNELVGIMCTYLGINIRESMLLEFSEVFKQQNAQ